MEILELIFVGLQLCGCFLDLAAVTSTGAAGYTGYQVYTDRKKRKQGIPIEHPEKRPTMWRAIIWAIIAVALIVLVTLRFIIAINTPTQAPR